MFLNGNDIWHSRLRATLSKLYEESRIKPSEVRKIVEKLNAQYLSNNFSIKNEREALTYALYFLPEHIPKIFFVYTELLDRYPHLIDEIENVYDFGCGSGTASILINLMNAKKKVFCLIDQNSFMLSIADKIMKMLSPFEFKTIKADFLKDIFFSTRPSLYIFMNTLSENKDRIEETINIVSNLVELNPSNFIIIIEPIKTDSINLLKKMRERFKTDILAPCLSVSDCPLMKSKNNMCSFSIRQDISIQLETVINAGHRFAKFCYLVLSRHNKESDKHLFRLLEYPKKRSYGYDLKLCNGEDIHNVKVFVKGSINKRKISRLSPNNIIRIPNLLATQTPNINSEQIETTH